jgi:hypothetical protein
MLFPLPLSKRMKKGNGGSLIRRNSSLASSEAKDRDEENSAACGTI